MITLIGVIVCTNSGCVQQLTDVQRTKVPRCQYVSHSDVHSVTPNMISYHVLMISQTVKIVLTMMMISSKYVFLGSVYVSKSNF